MSKSTISTFELFQRFPDAESARLYFEAARWPDGAACPASPKHLARYVSEFTFRRN